MTLKAPFLEEYIICLSIWSGGLFYAAYKFYLECGHLKEKYIHYFNGWEPDGVPTITAGSITAYKDYGDSEWTFWKQYIGPILVLLILRTAVRNTLPGRWSLGVDMLSCIYLLGCPGFAFHFVVTGIFFAVALAKRKVLTWSLAITVVAVRANFPLEEFFGHVQHFDQYLLEMTTCYLVIRSISFACDYGERTNATDDDQPMQTFLSFLEYQFFLPLYFLGPHLDYNTFCQKSSSGELIKWKKAAMVGAKVVAAVALTELGSHFLYPFSARVDRQAIQTMDLWSLAGLGYLLGQFFQVKYVALFGVFGGFAIANGIDWSPLPVCVAWVHKYSLMWQYFDHGLYVFLKRNIYIPLAKHGINPILSSLACYGFILFWHGFQWHIGVWVATNWVTLVLEKMIYSNITNERLRAVANLPVLLASMISNMYFLADSSFYGWNTLNRLILTNSLNNVIGVLILFYCSSFGGALIEKWKYPRANSVKSGNTSGNNAQPVDSQQNRDL